MPLKVTFDNNCIINIFDQNSISAISRLELEELINLSKSGIIDIALTTKIEADLSNDMIDDRRILMMDKLNKFSIVGSYVKNVDQKEIFTEIQRIISPGLNKVSKSYENNINDITHLFGHFINHRDIFITDDKGILKKGENLKINPGICVMSPKDCLNYVKKIIQLQEIKSFTLSDTDSEYISTPFSGKISFNYSNNNGIFSIGSGIFLFQTKWSKASNTSVHAYNDLPSIDKIALVNKNINEIKNITTTSDLDFSSRCRTVNTEQILIIKNINNIFAAIKVIDIKDDSRGDKEDNLTFEYKIQTNTFDDFSN